MLRFWDFECPVHGTYEVLMDGDPPDAIYCPEKVVVPVVRGPGDMGATERLCELAARRVWTHAPMVGGKEKGLYPRFDMQLGKMVDSKAHQQRLLHEREIRESAREQRDVRYLTVGKEEWERQAFAASEPDSVLTEADREVFRECAQKAYHDVETRAIPLENHPSIEQTEAGPIIVPDGKE